MPTYKIGNAAELLGVSVDTLRRWVDAGRLAASRTPQGQRVIEGSALAAFAATMAPERTVAKAAPASARNRFLGLVTEVTRDTVMAQVKLQSGPHRLVSLISREAADELKITPGMLVVASVKATNVVIELPQPR